MNVNLNLVHILGPKMNEERVQILASDSERELVHIFRELLML